MLRYAKKQLMKRIELAALIAVVVLLAAAVIAFSGNFNIAVRVLPLGEANQMITAE